MEQRVIDCEVDQKKNQLFYLIHSLLWSKKRTVLPEYISSSALVFRINIFFIDKNTTIRMDFPLLEACLLMYSFVDFDQIIPVCTTVFNTFHPLSCDILSNLIHKLNKMCVRFIVNISHIFYSRYHSMYCESMFLVWCFSNIL